MMRIGRIAAMAILAVGVLALSAQAGPVWGWRGDGTGRFPDANPPTEWGPDKNVVWKTPMPGPSNASPIIVGDRIFVCYDAPGKRKRDPVTGLACIDKSRGTILWSKTNELREVFTDEEWEVVTKRRKQLAALTSERNQVNKKIGVLNKRYNLRTEKARNQNEERRRKQWEKQAEAAKKKGRTVTPYKPQEYGPIPTPEQVAQMQKQMADHKARRTVVQSEMKAFADVAPTRVNGVTGFSTPTATSDGSQVYVLFASGVVACYDLDGNRKWTVNVGPSANGYGQAASPVLVGDRLIVPVNGVRALDKATGKHVWTARGAGDRYGTPFAAKVYGQEAVVTANGDVILAGDGKIAIKGVGRLEFASPLVYGGIAYYMEGRTRATALPSKPGTTQLKPVWKGTLTRTQKVDFRSFSCRRCRQGDRRSRRRKEVSRHLFSEDRRCLLSRHLRACS